MNINLRLELAIKRIESKLDCHTASIEMREDNDCAVRAIALLADVDYRTAHTACSTYRKHGHGMYLNKIERVLSQFGLEIDRVLGEDQLELVVKAAGFPSHTMTVNRIEQCKEMQSGHWLVYTTKHCFAMLDGQILDWARGSKKVVKRAVRFLTT